MDRIEIKHVLPYLPYGLKAEMLSYKSDYVGRQFDEIIGVHQWSKNGDWCLLTGGGSKPSLAAVKLVLRPLSDFNRDYFDKQIMWRLNPEYCNDYRTILNRVQTNTIKYYDMRVLFEEVFDVFGLIEQGLAIDVNTLKTDYNENSK